MKNYYKRTDLVQHIMIDMENNYVVVVYSTSAVKWLSVITNVETFTFYVNESTDETKLIPITETEFNNIKNEVISSI
jgi:hypothetical protein